VVVLAGLPSTAEGLEFVLIVAAEGALPRMPVEAGRDSGG
jgi:hypothetical protein